MKAILLSNNWNPNKSCNGVNNGRTDDTSFYSNQTMYEGELRYYVSVSNCYRTMSTDEQKSELEWFLRGKDFVIIDDSPKMNHGDQYARLQNFGW